MNYVGKMWRPPSEAKSLILQITVGCSHNECRFCNMYKNKDFYVKRPEKIKKDIENAAKSYNGYKRVFLADGDVLVMKTEKLLDIMQTIDKRFPYLERISSYARPENINRKSVSDLIKLKEHGLEMIYMGIESGSKKVLKKMKKGANPSEILEAGKKLKKAGITNSSTIILGLGGKEDSKTHAEDTASLISKLRPDYLSALTLMVKQDVSLYEEIETGDFQLLTPYEILDELYQIIEDIEVDQKCIFRTNHASNYYSIKGTLPEDKKRMLDKLKYILDNPDEYHLKGEKRRKL